MNMRKAAIISVFTVSSIVLVALAQRSVSEIKIDATDLGNGVYMLTGSGGNLGASVGEDGVFLIDDQLAPLTEDIVAALKELSEQPVDYVINTHYHGDHVGGNENFGQAGSVIVAHDNVRERMSTTQISEFLNRETPPYPDGALPVITFTHTVRFHLNGDHLHVIHLPNAHTDGDAIVHFESANVLHMGDTFWNGYYPFIDYEAGGTIDGTIAAAEFGLSLADENTHIIAGHGPLGDRVALERFRDVMKAARERVAAARADGKTLEEVKAAGLTAEWDSKWGQWFIKPDVFVEFVYRTLP